MGLYLRIALCCLFLLVLGCPQQESQKRSGNRDVDRDVGAEGDLGGDTPDVWSPDVWVPDTQVPDVEGDASELDTWSPDGSVDVGVAPALHVVRVGHAAYPQGWNADNEAWTITTTWSANAFSGESVLPAGVLAMAVDWEPERSEGRTIRPLKGSYSHAELAQIAFFMPHEDAVRVVVDGESVRFERVETSPAWHAGQLEGTQRVGGLFDDVLEALEQEGADHVELVLGLQSALRDRGGAPVNAGDLGRLFVTIGSEDGIAPEVRGSFNDWESSSAHEILPLRGRLSVRFVQGIEGHHAYKIVYGGGSGWFTDYGNPHIAWDGIDTGGVGAFNSIVNPAAREAGQGRLVWWPRARSEQLENERDVYVYLPQSYDEGSDHYPLLIVHDGNESITRGRFHEVADAMGAQAVLAFVGLPSQAARMDEYTIGSQGALGDRYAAFLVQTVVPMLESNFRLWTDRTQRGLAGASLGGLISFWTASQYPEMFGFAGGMSSTFFWFEDHMLGVINELGCQDINYYLDSGSPNDNHDVTWRMRDVLNELGCYYRHEVETNGRHEWSFWNGRFSNVLDAFLN